MKQHHIPHSISVSADPMDLVYLTLIAGAIGWTCLGGLSGRRTGCILYAFSHHYIPGSYQGAWSELSAEPDVHNTVNGLGA
jgi:hypothetical protein